jgi:hypothetical protein
MTVYYNQALKLPVMLPHGGHLVIKTTGNTASDVLKQLEEKELGYPVNPIGWHNQPLEIGDILLIGYRSVKLIYIIYVKPDLDEMLKASRSAGRIVDTRPAWLNPMIQPEEGDEDDPREKKH